MLIKYIYNSYPFTLQCVINFVNVSWETNVNKVGVSLQFISSYLFYIVEALLINMFLAFHGFVTENKHT